MWCSSPPSSDASSDAFDADAYVSELRAKREEKDDFFGSHPQSPIPPEERDDFDGLDYFDPDPDYRVTASVETHADPEPVTMDTSTDGEVRYLRVATFHFELRDTDLTRWCEVEGKIEHDHEELLLMVRKTDLEAAKAAHFAEQAKSLTHNPFAALLG